MRVGELTQEESPAFILFLVITAIAGFLFAELWTMWFFAANLAALVNSCRPATVGSIVSVSMEGFVVVAFGVILEYLIYNTKWLKTDASDGRRTRGKQT